ncbi:MAG: cell division protein ZapE, partial [Granulosicoccus sp.]
MPIDRYEAEIREGRLSADPEQQAVMRRLHFISEELKRRRSWKPPSRSLFARWSKSIQDTVEGVRGLYLWGGVGRGKTHLCDLFFEEVALHDKTRLHFHSFMQQIHTDLRAYEGVDEPLSRIADDWAKRARLLLLDEIHVNDITDAMLLGGLLTQLFRRGVTLVTTSNVPPNGLYKGGLQRARFLPAIAQIEMHTDVLEMTGVTDYRLRMMEKEPIYLVQQSADGGSELETKNAMQAHFDRLRSDLEKSETHVTVNSREIPVIAQSADVVWFSFQALCETDRSTQDYIELATLYHTVMISNIPVMDENSSDAARRFVNLVDEFYDRGIKLIVSAEATADKLYTGKRL